MRPRGRGPSEIEGGMEISEVEALVAEFRQALAEASDPEALGALKTSYVGKKGKLKQAMKTIKSVPAEQRRDFAAALNQAQATVEAELEAAAGAAQQRAIAAQVEAEWQDLSLPGTGARRGLRHPVNLVERRCLAVLRQLGFERVEGPEVETAFYNFDALNIPEHHPARDMQDTFWVEGNRLLRSHTTTVQARVLEEGRALPIKIASAGRVYRNEAVDNTHLAMFHQLEGLWIDRDLTFPHLKGVLAFVARALYGDRPLRFKPKFYPYTEPSVGMDLQTPEGDWVTILGAGMVHRNVLTQFGYDPTEVSGFAFGLGTTRMASQLVGLSALRPLYTGDVRLLQALHRGDQ